MAVDLLFAARNSHAVLTQMRDYLDDVLGDPALRALVEAAICVQEVAIAGATRGSAAVLVPEIDPHARARRQAAGQGDAS